MPGQPATQPRPLPRSRNPAPVRRWLWSWLLLVSGAAVHQSGGGNVEALHGGGGGEDRVLGPGRCADTGVEGGGDLVDVDGVAADLGSGLDQLVEGFPPGDVAGEVDALRGADGGRGG